jgi:hypothetical protein
MLRSVPSDVSSFQGWKGSLTSTQAPKEIHRNKKKKKTTASITLNEKLHIFHSKW